MDDVRIGLTDDLEVTVTSAVGIAYILKYSSVPYWEN